MILKNKIYTFDIRIEEINYYYNLKCEGEFGELPKVKSEVLIRDEDNFMSPVIKRTWVFDVFSYAEKAKKVAGLVAIELIIEEIVKKMWTELHKPIPKEKAVRIDMYLPLHANNTERFYMNSLFTKYLVNERSRDKYYRNLCNSTFGIISHDMRHMYPVPIIPESSPLYGKDMRQTFIDETLLDTTLADSIMDTFRYAQIIDEDRAKAKEKIKEYEKMKIKNVIFNDPATIVFWRDGSKTVVKAKDEPFDPEKGLAMAIAKKAYGNEGNYYNEFKKFIKDDAKEDKNE